MGQSEFAAMSVVRDLIIQADDQLRYPTGGELRSIVEFLSGGNARLSVVRVLTDNEIARKRQQGLDDDWPGRVDPQFAPAGRLIAPDEIAAVVVTFLSDECGPISGQVCDLEQYPLLGRNPPKTIQPAKEA
jgi:hypothetical protein